MLQCLVLFCHYAFKQSTDGLHTLIPFVWVFFFIFFIYNIRSRLHVLLTKWCHNANVNKCQTYCCYPHLFVTDPNDLYFATDAFDVQILKISSEITQFDGNLLLKTIIILFLRFNINVTTYQFFFFNLQKIEHSETLNITSINHDSKTTRILWFWFRCLFRRFRRTSFWYRNRRGT